MFSNSSMDRPFCIRLFDSKTYRLDKIILFNFLASHSSWGGFRFVGNPEDSFCRSRLHCSWRFHCCMHYTWNVFLRNVYYSVCGYCSFLIQITTFNNTGKYNKTGSNKHSSSLDKLSMKFTLFFESEIQKNNDFQSFQMFYRFIML